MMKRLLPYILPVVAFLLMAVPMQGQVQKYKELHEVKRKETIFGIARQNGLTIEELIKANPEMNTPGYELKKGTFIRIPYPSTTPATQQKPFVSRYTSQAPSAQQTGGSDVRYREIRVGVMLPLHDDNGDGKRMVEYYRGVLMACDSLKTNGISVDIRAWNLAEQTDINSILKDPHAADRDVIIGPLYTKQVKPLADFAQARGIKLLVPCSINSQEVYNNTSMFQVFQNGYTLNHSYVYRFRQRFKDSNVIIIDCNDSTSTKGGFTTTLRRTLDQEGQRYVVTNLNTAEPAFKRCFEANRHNVVVLNTSRSTELTIAFAKLNALVMTTPDLQISMFGYHEWMMFTKNHLENFYKFDTYIPSVYYNNPLSPRTEQFKKKYRWNFHQDMQAYHQRFAMMGFDQAYFMLKGLHLYGTRFTGASGMVGYTPIQNPLHFERMGNGGLQNKAILFVHYTNDNRIETINY
jgi:hypothetical protein